MIRTAAIFALLGSAATAEQYYLPEALEIAKGAPAVIEVLTNANAECVDGNAGELVIFDDRAIVATDLDGDLGRDDSGQMDDWVVDLNYASCTLGTLWAGSGGAPISFIRDGSESAAWTGGSWELIRFNEYLPVVILIGRHGGACDSYGAAPCVQAVTVSDEGFLTVLFPEQNDR